MDSRQRKRGQGGGVPAASDQPTSLDDSDQRLLEEIAAGRASAFWRLWDRYKPVLFRLCLKVMGGDRSEAEDALSRAMLLAWDKLPQHAERIVNLRAWLSRLTYNLCIDMHKERQRRESRFDQPEDLDAVPLHPLVTQCDQPERELLDHELYDLLWSATKRLPERLRGAFVMRCWEGLDYERIAGQLGITNANVRKRVQQARARLGDEIRGYFE